MRRSNLLIAISTAVALVGVAACGGSPKTGAPDAPGVAAGAEQGMVLLPVPADPTVSFNVWFQAGSQDDPAGKEGLAWLTGQLLAEGATTRHPYQEIVQKLFPMAAAYEVSVDREMTTLTGRVHRDHLSAFQSLFMDAYLRPAFAEEDIERIRAQGLSYLQKTLRYASDEELGKAALDGFVFGGTRYAHPIMGTVAGLQSITAADVRGFYESHYTRDRTVFGIGGGYTPETVPQIAATRAELPAPAGGAAARQPAPEPEAIEGRRVLLVDKPGADASISFGFPIDVHRGDKDFYALWIAASWLGEHRNSSSHLYQVIREARGLNYGDYAYIEAFPNGGRQQMPPTNVGRRQQSFEVWIRTLPNDKGLFALRAAMREVRMLVDNGMTPEQFELTRSFLRKYIRHFAPTTAARLGYAVDDRFYGIDGSHLEKFVQMMDALTVEDVNQAIRKHLQYKDVKIAIVTGEAEKIREALVNETPTPITYDTEKPAAVLAEDKEIAIEPLSVSAENIRVVPVDQMFEQ